MQVCLVLDRLERDDYNVFFKPHMITIAYSFTISEHRCEVSGCGDTIVIDGNMKNNRDVCFATNAGYVEYKGLPGRVRTGCPNSPQYMSRYCSLRDPIVAIPQKIIQDGDDPNPPVSTTEEDQVGLIINKRVTRSSTLYEVSNICFCFFYTLLQSLQPFTMSNTS